MPIKHISYINLVKMNCCSLKFSVAVRLSFAYILRQVYLWSVTMVTTYDVISSRWSSHFWVKMHVFSTLFRILDKNQGGSQDGDHVWCLWLQRPPVALTPSKNISSCREGQRLSLEGKIVSKYYNISKTRGRGFHQPPTPPPPPPLLCTTVGVWLCVYARGLIIRYF